MTFLTICTAGFDAVVAMSRSGGSPIKVLVTAKEDFEIDLKLYPPCFLKVRSKFMGYTKIGHTSRQTATLPLARVISI
jgi:hypothetical protein